MSRSFTFVLLNIFLILVACTQKPNYIIPIKITDYYPVFITCMTVEESGRRSHMMFNDIQSQTVGKEIPPTNIYSLEGDTLNIKDVLPGINILISCDAHCGFSDEHALNDYPKAIARLKENGIHPKTLCVAMRSEDDRQHPDRFNDLIDRLREQYEHLYIIDMADAMHMNMISGSVRMVLNGQQEVVSMGSGISNDELRIFNELYPILASQTRNP